MPTEGLIGAAISAIGTSFFADGGLITEPVVGYGRSGRRYVLGESGPETVTPAGRSSGNASPIVVNYAPQINAIDTASGLQFLGKHKDTIVGLVGQAYNQRFMGGPRG